MSDLPEHVARNRGYWDAMGDACPAGYTYDACNPHGRQCVKLERVACQ